ncbi:MAG: GDSL-type esterase/lipase family protein [Myxococcota bacterium]
MRHVRVLPLLALLLVLAAARPVRAAEVVVFGDSWAEGGWDELDDALSSKGFGSIGVHGAGVGGTTAEMWATQQPQALPDAVSDNPDAQWVWLSIGGNDLFAHYADGHGDQTAADNDAHIRVMLDALFAVHPDVRVVMFGYDYVNFEQSQECIALGLAYFKDKATPQINEAMYQGVHAVQQGIADDYANVTYVPSVLGTLQVAGGIAGAPNPLLPSPSEYMSDCIHPTSEGYSLILGALVDGYWGIPKPDAVIAEGDLSVCVGDTATLTDGSTNASERAWTVDGAAQGGGASVTVPTSAAGTTPVGLEVRNGAWEDTDEVEVTIVAAPSITLTGPDQVTAGEVVTYTVIGASDASLAWDVAGADSTTASGDEVEVAWGTEGPGSIEVTATAGPGCAATDAIDVTVAAPPEPEPEPQPEPGPEPTPDQAPEPTPDQAPEPMPEPQPEPQPEPMPEPQPEPQPEPGPDAFADTAGDVSAPTVESDVAGNGGDGGCAANGTPPLAAMAITLVGLALLRRRRSA